MNLLIEGLGSTKVDFNPVTLTDSQNSVKEQVLNAISEGKKRIVLCGSAGTGKTTCVNAIISDFVERGFLRKGSISILAPTNKAVQVLITKNVAKGYKEFGTVHQALNLKQVINESNGIAEFKPDKYAKNRPFRYTDLIVIDESSMLNSEILGYLNEYKNIPIIFLGDEKQLNPVGEKTSPIFEMEDAETFELTEIVRQGAGNPIIELSRDLNLLRYGENNENEVGGYIFTRNKVKCVEFILENIHDAKYLAWTNAEVNETNSIIRSVRYGADANKIEMGETIVFNEPFTGKLDSYFTSEETEVNDLKIIEEDVAVLLTGKLSKRSILRFKFKCYVINNDITVIHEDSEGGYFAALREIKLNIQKQIATWKDFYSFKEQYANINYSYAITVHKSQGSTYKYVIINCNDLNKNKSHPEGERLWYTAITRASNKVILLS